LASNENDPSREVNSLAEGSPPNAKTAVAMTTKNDTNSFAAFSLGTSSLPDLAVQEAGRLYTRPDRCTPPVPIGTASDVPLNYV
jgi:hypothetical protein